MRWSMTAGLQFWGEHAARVLVSAARRNEFHFARFNFSTLRFVAKRNGKVREGGAQRSAQSRSQGREARALPDPAF